MASWSEEEATELKKCIEFWESILFHNQFLMSPTTKYFVKHTIKQLEELQKIKEITDG